MEFQNKIIIVTGGASGIGLASVEAFCKEGAKVVIADFSDNGQQVSDRLNNQGYTTKYFKIDVRDEQQNKALIDFTVDNFGGLDVMFANAGVADDAAIENLSFDKWQKTIDINLTGVYLADKYAIEYWLGNNRGGTIVNCGSIHSWVGKKHVTAYAAAKGGVKLLTQTLACDYAAKGIRINAVCPGYIDTPLLSQLDDTIKQHLISLHPIGRLGKAEEVANVVLFLASEKASFVNGAALLVDGGYVSQ